MTATAVTDIVIVRSPFDYKWQRYEESGVLICGGGIDTGGGGAPLSSILAEGMLMLSPNPNKTKQHGTLSVLSQRQLPIQQCQYQKIIVVKYNDQSIIFSMNTTSAMATRVLVCKSCRIYEL